MKNLYWLCNPALHHVQQLKVGQNAFVKEEKISMMIFDLLAHSQFTGENIQLVRQVISSDTHSTYDEIIAETSLSHGTIERIIHDCLKMKNVTSRWVPHQLTDE